MKMLDEQRQDEERIRRILAERDNAQKGNEEREQMLKAFIRSEKDKTPVNHSLVTAAGLALFANYISQIHPAIVSFNMHLDTLYLHPVPDSIIFFDAYGAEYETIELGPNPTQLGGEVYSYLAGLDLNGIADYTNRTLQIRTLNEWKPKP